MTKCDVCPIDLKRLMYDYPNMRSMRLKSRTVTESSIHHRTLITLAMHILHTQHAKDIHPGVKRRHRLQGKGDARRDNDW